MAKRTAQGAGSIRQRADGLWEARYTVGRDPATGKQVQKSVYGKTQQEVRKKLTAAASDLDKGIYSEPQKITLGEWLCIWLEQYCGAVKPRTLTLYHSTVEYRVAPFLGALPLSRLTPVILQKFYNDSLAGELKEVPPVSAKTVRNIHGILHKALQQAVSVGYLKANPAAACVLPKVEKKEMQVLNEAQTKAFLQAIESEPFRRLFLVALFTGMREGELLGLTWDSVDFTAGTIRVYQQLQRHQGAFVLMSPKNGKPRTISPAPYVMDLLWQERTAQTEARLLAGPLWEKSGYVFTDKLGRHLNQQTVFKHFKAAVRRIDCPQVRFHDLRHSYAVAALRAGIDVKTVSANLGHATVAFTLDIYGHVTDEMRRASADKMQAYIATLKA